MENNKNATLFSSLQSLLNGLKDGQCLVIDREEVRIGVKKRNGQINLTEKIQVPVYKSADTQLFINSTSIVQSPGNAGIKNFSGLMEEAKSAVKRRTKKEQFKIQRETALLKAVLLSLAESKKVKLSRTNIGRHLYGVKTSDWGHQIYFEIYPKGHELEFKPKTGEIKYIRISGSDELVRLSLGPGDFQGKLIL